MTITARIDDTDVATAVLVLSGPGARPTAVTLEGRRARVDGALTGRVAYRRSRAACPSPES